MKTVVLDPSRDEGEHRRAGDADSAPATVLVVPSARLDVRALVRALGTSGGRRFQVDIATADRALERLVAGHADALVLDLGSAGGPDLLRRSRAVAPDTALILLGGRRLDDTLGLHPYQLVPHGTAPDEIARCVYRALERRELELELERRTAELAESQSRFQNIIERTTDAIVVVGSNGRVRFVNPAAEALFGRPAELLVGQEFGFALVSDDATEIDIVRTDRAEPVVAELRTAETQWSGDSAQIVSLRDVTDRRKAEQRAHRLLLEQTSRERAEEASRRSRFLAEASAALDASLNLEFTLGELARLIVPRLAEWCVIDLIEETGAHRRTSAHVEPEPDALLAAALPEDTADAFQRLLRTDEVLLLRGLDADQLAHMAGDAAHARLLTDLGARSLIIVPLNSRERRVGTLLLGCGGRDFDTADRALAEEVAARAARAIDNARLYNAALAASQAKSDFLAIVSHELRTPLNAVMGYTDILISGITGTLDEAQLRQLRRIDASARHLLQLIEEILAHAGLEDGRDEPHPREVTVGELIDGITAVAEPLVHEKELEFNIEVPDPAAPLVTDPGKIRQVVLNLISNAVKFTDAGSVTLRASVGADGVLAVTVADTGIGIDPAHHERVFEAFWQVEQPLTRHAGGTGLGLSVSRRLAEMLGGTITVQSEPGSGSVFTLRVPTRYREAARGGTTSHAGIAGS